MARELRAGMSFSGDLAHIVIVEVIDGEIHLRQIDERPKATDDIMWFMEILKAVDRKTLSRLSRISISLDHSMAHFLRFPLDTTLSQVDQNQQVAWEFSQLLAEDEVKDLINDVHLLRTNAREQVADALAVGFRRSLVFRIQQVCGDQHLNLQFLDVNLFASEHALWYNHPELRARIVCLLEVSHSLSVASVLNNGRMTSYHSSFTSSSEEVVAFVRQLAQASDLTNIVAYGTALTYEMVKALRATFGSPVATLNPFRRLTIGAQTRNYEQFLGLEHRFVPSIGCAVRTR